jgi:hypothetical protein
MPPVGQLPEGTASHGAFHLLLTAGGVLRIVWAARTHLRTGLVVKYCIPLLRIVCLTGGGPKMGPVKQCLGRVAVASTCCVQVLLCCIRDHAGQSGRISTVLLSQQHCKLLCLGVWAPPAMLRCADGTAGLKCLAQSESCMACAFVSCPFVCHGASGYVEIEVPCGAAVVSSWGRL